MRLGSPWSQRRVPDALVLRRADQLFGSFITLKGHRASTSLPENHNRKDRTPRIHTEERLEFRRVPFRLDCANNVSDPTALGQYPIHEWILGITSLSQVRRRVISQVTHCRSGGRAGQYGSATDWVSAMGVNLFARNL